MTEKRKNLYGKSAPGEMKASVYALRQVKVEEDVRALEYAGRLIEWGMHPKLVEEALPGVPRVTLKRLRDRAGRGEEKVGVPPQSKVPIIGDIHRHIQASLFVVILRNYVDRIERVVTAGVFIEAFGLTRAAIGESMVLTCSEAWNILVKDWVQKKIKLTECLNCQTPHIATVAAISVHGSMTHGDCPLCRGLVARDGWLPVRISQANADRSRALIDRYLGG